MPRDKRVGPAVFTAVFLSLFFGLNHGIAGYFFRVPGAFADATPLHLLGSVLAPVLLAAGLLCGLWALGEVLLRLAASRVELSDWHPILALALGAAAAALCLLSLGAAGAFFPVVLKGFGGVLLALGAFRLRALRRPRLAEASPWLWAAAGLLTYLALSAIVRASAPPTDVDVLKYHLVLPQLYLRGHTVEAIPWQVFSHWPQAMEMLYSLPLAYGVDAAAALLHTGLCALLVLLTYRLARSDYGLDATGAAAAACLLAAQPVMTRQAGAAMTDGALALCYLLCCGCLRRWRGGNGAAWLRLAGLMAGAGAAIKLHGAVLSVGAAVWVALEPRSLRERLRAAGTFLAWSAVFAAPWYLKEWASSGNPVWPFFPGVFGGGWGAETVSGLISPRGFELEWRWILLGEGALFLLVPAGAAVVWAAWRRERPVGTADLIPALLYLPAAATAISLWRYMLPFFPALAVLAGWGFSRAVRGGRLPRALAALLVAFGLYGVLRSACNNELFPALGVRSRARPELSSREAYLSRALTGHEFTRAVSAAVGPSDLVLLVAENRGYYLTGDYFYGDPSEQAVIDFESLSGPEALRRRLADAGVTHLAINEDDDWYADAVRRTSPRYYALVLETARRYGTAVLTIQRRTLYALRPA